MLAAPAAPQSIDVGAHRGVTALALSKAVGTGGRVFAFEPVLFSAGLLSATRIANSLPQLTVVPMALGDGEGISMLRVSHPWHGMVGITPGMRARTWHVDGEVVYDVGFDGIWPRLRGDSPRVHGVKIDAQGSEAHVVRGMRQTLRESRPRLVIEWHEYADRDELHDALQSAGYSPLGRDLEHRGIDRTPRLSHGHSYEFSPAP